MVKDKDLKPTGQQFKPEPYIPKTETRIILEQQDLYPDLGHEDVSSSKGYGPCRGSSIMGISVPSVYPAVCPHSKEELFWQLKQAESELQSQKQQFANELRDLKAKIENHHSRLEYIEELQRQKETGMTMSKVTQFIPPVGPHLGIISEGFIYSVSRNDISQARSSEREAKYSVISKINSLTSYYGG
jgi:hypothetical protein